MNGKNFAYTYDGNGMRYKKTVDGSTTEYYLDGSQILAEYRKGTKDLIVYIYDASGVSGMIYKGEYYFYEKNTLGDIVAVRNASGSIVATYVYDAWGNILYKSGTMAGVNPFRYRGYYYDTETGFYYLQTRYYDPTIMRFINADDYELVATLASVLGQLNMYAYCGNNPIMYTDETGEIFLTSLLVGLVSGVVIGATVGAVSAAMNGLSGVAFWDSVAEYALFGMLLGGAGGAMIGLAPTIGAGLGAMMSGTAGAGASVALASTYVVAAGATAALGMNLLFAELPKHGGPSNGTLSNDNSIGYYDGDGNLIERYDFKGKPHFIKELGRYCLPHTHHYRWGYIKGVLRQIAYWVTG